MASMDCIGLNNHLGVGWLDITSVTQAWHWNLSRVNDMGTANVTLVTMRDRTGGSIGEVSSPLDLCLSIVQPGKTNAPRRSHAESMVPPPHTSTRALSDTLNVG